MELDEARATLLEHAGALLPTLLPAEKSSVAGMAENPLCTDRVRFSARLEDERIMEVGIAVTGCSMCKASASLLVEAIEGKSRGDANKFIELAMQELAHPATPPWPVALEEIAALAPLREKRMRLACAMVAWKAAKEALS